MLKHNTFFVVLSAVLMCLPCLSKGPNGGGADLAGYVLEEDGITPVMQATIQMKKLPDGKILTSSPSDRDGVFKIAGVGKGIYIFGVRTPQGNFNALEVLGILVHEDKYARMDIVLSSFPENDDSASFPALLPNPVGQAVVAAGNSAVVYGTAVINDEPREAGPFRIRLPQP